MVLQVGADAGAVGDHVDAVVGEMRAGADARQHQELGRVEGGGGEDHLGIRADDFLTALAGDLDADGAAVLEDDAARKAADDVAFARSERGLEIGVGGRPALALVDGHLEGRETFLLFAVIVGRHRVARLSARLDEGAGEGLAIWPRVTCRGPSWPRQSGSPPWPASVQFSRRL